MMISAPVSAGGRVPTTGILAELAPITLDALLVNASLQTRVDRKYLLPRAALEPVLVHLGHDTQVLEIDGVRAFGYESIYFDTPGNDSYLMAARKRRHRFKIRTRSYLDSAECYLEVKTRGGRSLTVKDRLEYSIHNRAQLTTEARDYTNAVLRESGIVGAEQFELAPVLTTRYRRSTLYIPTSQSRATIDLSLSWSDDAAELDLPELAVVETKSGSTPSAVDRLLWSHGHRPASLSKFGTGRAALRPDLPSNKWNRILTRHFAQPAIATGPTTTLFSTRTTHRK